MAELGLRRRIVAVLETMPGVQVTPAMMHQNPLLRDIPLATITRQLGTLTDSKCPTDLEGRMTRVAPSTYVWK